jgi:Kef-type K+ transport system membrane component KefB
VDAFAAISHGDLLKLVASIAILLGSARLLAELMNRIGQPAVLGEILAGVILGPSVLSGVFPALGRLIVPQTDLQSQLLDGVAFIGIMTLMVVVGMETDLALIRRRARTAVAVGIGGLVIPFLSGLAIAGIFPDSLLGDGKRPVFALFLAVALALSAIPVLAKILADLGMLRSEFGQTALAAGMIDDVLGWSLLGLVTAFAATGEITLTAMGVALGSVLLFFVATVWVARPLARWSLGLVEARSHLRDRLLSLIVVFAFGWGAFTHALHLEPILGAFAIGIIFGQMKRLPVESGQKLESITFGVFAPIFLATAGLRLRLDVLLEPELLVLTLSLLAVAAAGKLVGAFVAARFVARTSVRHAIGLGVALNARGVLGVIVATFGLSMGIFGVEIYSMVVVTSLLTSMAAPVGLKKALGRELGETALGPVSDVRRVLVPVRLRKDAGDTDRSLDAAVLGSMSSAPAVTLMTVVESGQRKEAQAFLAALARDMPASLEVDRRVVVGDPVSVITDEAAKGYDLIFLGGPSPDPASDHLFEPMIDDVVRLSPCPSLIFTARGSVWPPRRIMVPTGGAPAATRAAELAYLLGGEETHVLLFHAVDPSGAGPAAPERPDNTAVRLDIGHGIVTMLRQIGEERGVAVETEVVMGEDPISAILDRAARDVDLIVLGTNVRTGSPRLFLGPKIERLVENTPCSTIIYNV